MNMSQVATMNPVRMLHMLGQSVWLDFIRRDFLTSGALQRLIVEDGLCGMTSNPTIFEKAITGSSDYTDALRALEQEPGLDAKGRYERLAIEDIRTAADLLQPVFARTKRRDGYVSLEVSPYLAHDTLGTINEAKRLWAAVGRDNLMIKIPATPEGISAIAPLISQEINVNVTLIFSQEVYALVAEAYLKGLERLAERGGDVAAVASVASLFVSRIDTAVDRAIAARVERSTNERERTALRALQGASGIANAKLAYQQYHTLFSDSRWAALARRGAMTQRLLWASTGTKNPRDRDVRYVEELIGPETVNTMPPATFEAFQDHGRPEGRLTEGIDEAKAVMLELARMGLSMTEITDRLLAEGVQLFTDAFESLLAAVEPRIQGNPSTRLDRFAYTLPPDMASAVRASLQEWREGGKVRRLWNGDASLWTDQDEGRWLGWLGITGYQLAHLQLLTSLAEETKRRGFTHALVLGMGGSSLCPDVMQRTFGSQAGFPKLLVLDSTDPAQIQAVEKAVNLASTLFIVSSKSGSTLEPHIFKQYFFDRVRCLVGDKEAGQRFIAITDPGSALQQTAESEGFRHLYYGMPSIGGRYSALSNFGMVPAAVMGVDVAQFLERAEEMAGACASSVPIEKNPGVVLGTILGVLARHGRDKVTVIASPGLEGFGAWLEQLLAESTGKAGQGIIPVDREVIAPPDVYGSDRLFVYIRLDREPAPRQDEAVDRLERAGHPVVRIAVAEPYDLGQEFFRWEFATAVAGSILGINPFNQPDVEASKLVTKQLMAEYERSGALPSETPLLTEEGLQVFADPRFAAVLQLTAGPAPSLTDCLKQHLRRLAAGDYFALLAYIAMTPAHDLHLQAIRRSVRAATGVATCVGFGPRFLHSTGQAYKGGPNSGVFLQITCEDAADLPVPGQRYSFGAVKAAQARGDFQVLADRGRRLLRVHLGADVEAGCAILRTALAQALA